MDSEYFKKKAKELKFEIIPLENKFLGEQVYYTSLSSHDSDVYENAKFQTELKEDNKVIAKHSLIDVPATMLCVALVNEKGEKIFNYPSDIEFLTNLKEPIITPVYKELFDLYEKDELVSADGEKKIPCE